MSTATSQPERAPSATPSPLGDDIEDRKATARA